MPSVRIRQVLLVLAVVAVGAIIVTIMPHFLDLATSNDSSPTTQCDDEILKSTTVDTTLSMSGNSEKPSFSSDTTFTVPKYWRGVDGLVSSPDEAKFRDAVTCFLPDKSQEYDSQAYRTGPPTVSVDDSEQAKRKKQELVGDHITLEDYVQSNDGDPSYLPGDLGVWSLYNQGATTSVCVASQPKQWPHSYLLAVLCPVLGKSLYGQWTIHLDLQGSTIVSSSHRPVQYSGGTSATWKVKNLGDTGGFWVELRPDRASGLYFAIQKWHGGVIPLLSGMIGWSTFFVLLLILARRGNLWISYVQGNKKWNAAKTLQGICICALLACALIITVDAIWSLSSDKTPHATYARIEAILVFGLVSAVGLQAWRRSWRKFLVILAVLILGTLAYFGPREITLESGQFSPSTANLDRWYLYGYLNHLFVGAALVGVLIAAALAVGKTAVETGIPAKEPADSTAKNEPPRHGPSRGLALVGVLIAALAVSNTAVETGIPAQGLADSTAKTESPRHGPSRATRYVIGVFCGMAVVLQWLRVAYDQWDHRRLFPGESASLESISSALLPQFPWFPDFILHWLPALLYYSAIIYVFATLAELARADTPGKRAVISSVPPAFQLTVLLFAIGVVGLYGSYRSVQIPISFLVSLVLMRMVLRPTDRLEIEIQHAKEKANEADLEQLQQVLLQNSRTEAASQERQDEGGDDTGTIMRWWRRRRSDTNIAAAEDSVSSFSDQEIALALGPRIGWWGNALYATKISALVAILVVAYDAYQANRSGVFSGFLQARDGFFLALQWVLSEVITWITVGFTLGALWPLIPGRRGVYKGLVLGAVAVVSAGVDYLIARGFSQDTYDFISWSVLILSFFAIVAIILDVSTLKKVGRKRWEFIDYLRLRDTRWLATYGAVVIIVVFAIIQQIRSGQPLSTVPVSVINSILRNK